MFLNASTQMVGAFADEVETFPTHLGERSLFVRVPSRGCTDEHSFSYKFESLDGRTIVNIQRVVVDDCKAWLPNGVEVEVKVPDDVNFSGQQFVVRGPTF